jgi:hypothetical protein
MFSPYPVPTPVPTLIPIRHPYPFRRQIPGYL